MGPTNSPFPQCRALHEHGPVVHKCWEEITSAIRGVQLPVLFYESDASQVALLNEELDDACDQAFSPVINWIAQVEAGVVPVKAITDADVEHILSALTDKGDPDEPEQSVPHVKEFAARVLKALKRLSESPDATR